MCVCVCIHGWGMQKVLNVCMYACIYVRKESKSVYRSYEGVSYTYTYVLRINACMHQYSLFTLHTY
jgi:hypothetical protein